MGNIIITMPKRETASRIENILKRNGVWEDIIICTRGVDTLQTAKEQDISLVICAKRFSDMGYQELLDYLPPTVHMILLTKDSSMLSYSSNLQRLMMPLRQTELMEAVRKHLPDDYIIRKKRKPKRSPQEQKIIDEAKQSLMDLKKMSEPDAFRYIQKNSMDTGTSMVEAAQMILMLLKM